MDIKLRIDCSKEIFPTLFNQKEFPEMWYSYQISDGITIINMSDNTANFFDSDTFWMVIQIVASIINDIFVGLILNFFELLPANNKCLCAIK